MKKPNELRIKYLMLSALIVLPTLMLFYGYGVQLAGIQVNQSASDSHIANSKTSKRLLAGNVKSSFNTTF